MLKSLHNSLSNVSLTIITYSSSFSLRIIIIVMILRISIGFFGSFQGDLIVDHLGHCVVIGCIFCIFNLRRPILHIDVLVLLGRGAILQSFGCDTREFFHLTLAFLN